MATKHEISDYFTVLKDIRREGTDCPWNLVISDNSDLDYYASTYNREEFREYFCQTTD